MSNIATSGPTASRTPPRPVIELWVVVSVAILLVAAVIGGAGRESEGDEKTDPDGTPVENPSGSATLPA